MDKKFLHKVIDQIVSETRIDYNELSPTLYTPFLPSSLYLSPSFPFLPPSSASFSNHCRDVYGLNNDEVDYVWDEYKKIIYDKIKTKDNLNEARISSKLNSDYLDEVAQYLIDNTVIIPDKTMSVSHEKSKRGKIIIPVKDNIELKYYYNTLLNPSIVLLFSDEMENVYGLDPGLEIKYVWDKYKKHIFSNI
mgnify:CR=1 FL=1|jgi:hypothetical protein